MRVCFVGTGNMGGPMAANILKAGHQLTVFDARAEATAPLEKLGARRATNLPAVAAAVDVTLTSLPNDALVLKLLNNYAALTNQAALCEVMALADRLGVDRQTVGEVLTHASGASYILERKLSALVGHNYQG